MKKWFQFSKVRAQLFLRPQPFVRFGLNLRQAHTHHHDDCNKNQHHRLSQ